MDEGNRHPNRGSYRKIIFIIMIYIFLTLTSKMSRSSASNTKHMLDLLRNNAGTVAVQDILGFFQHEETYQEVWTKQPAEDVALSENEGHFEMRVNRLTYSGVKQTKCKVLLSLYNGQYADGGILTVAFHLDDSAFTSRRTDSEQLRYELAENHTLKGLYEQEVILVEEAEGQLELTEFWMGFRLKGDNGVGVEMGWKGLKMEVGMEVLGEESRLLKTMLFAVVLFVVSFLPFSGIMQIIKAML